MAPEQNQPENNQGKGKGKAPNTSSEGRAARPRGRRAPTVSEVAARLQECIQESRLAQEAIRLEILAKLEALQRAVADLTALQRSVADLTTYAVKISEKQVTHDTEMAVLREKLNALQRQPTEPPVKNQEKRSAEIPIETLEQLWKEGLVPQPVPRRRFKIAVSKNPTYSDSEEEDVPVEEAPSQEPHQEKPAKPESGGEGSTAEQTPPLNSEVPAPPPSPAKPPSSNAPSVETMAEKVSSPQSTAGNPLKCPKCKFLHKGKCTWLPNTCFKCMQQGHLAKDCSAPRACNICKEPGHVAKQCPKGRNKKKE